MADGSDSNAKPKNLRALLAAQRAQTFARKAKRDRKAKSHLLPASDVLQILLRNSKSDLSDGFTRWKLEQQWADVVGPEMAKNTLPCAFERGTLHVWVRHSAWLQQLWFFQETIREKVNAHLSREWAKHIRFTLSRRAAEEGPAER